MADRSPLFLLLIFWTLSTGVFGAEHTPVSSSSGETVHLPCRNTDQYCSTSGTTWIYSRDTQTAAVELITLGVKKTNSERLNLGSDCSLTISRVTTEDAGYYTCQQWSGPGGHQYGADSHVFLQVVAAEAKTTPTTTTTTTTTTTATSATTRTGAAAAVTPEHNTNTIKAAKTTTTVTPLHNTNPKIENPKAASPAPDPKTKAEPKPQAEKTDETPKAEAQTAAAAAATPDHNTNTTTQAAGSSSAVLSVLLSAAALAVFIAAVLCLIQRRRRAAHQRASGESAEQTEDSVTYSEVTCAGKKPEKSASDDDGNDSVTYAAVSRRA
nr:diverse immunoglobulin domain-containing protein 1.1 isoform X2 [Danio rerio]|eukprot:XP_009297261.1 diverse immunoglobulin domain-containing protein 1.1 isoform X2 [Danio rerio]